MSRKKNSDVKVKKGRQEVKQEVKTSENVEKLTFLQKIIPPSVLTILTAAFYYPSLNYPFQFDDLANITKKFAIRFQNPFGNWLHHSRWMGDWLNTLNYKIGRFDPFYYRLFNLILHISAGIFLFYLILQLCHFLKKESFLYKNARLISFATSALFLLHPVQTQTISYVVQARLEGLATLFVIATLFFIVKAFSTKNIFLRIGYFIVGTIVSILSWGTKEIIVVIPLLFLLIDWFFISQGKWINFKKRIWYYVVFCTIFVLVFLNYMGIDYLIRAFSLKMVTANNRGNILTNNAYDVITPLHFLISEFKVILHYLLMFLWPFVICVEYDWKLSESFFAVDSFFPFLAILGIFSVAIYSLIKKKNSFIAFGLFWFFICVAPRTTIIPSPELLCDYKTYLASVGWLFVLAVVLVYLLNFAIKNFKKIPEYFYNFNYQLAVLAVLMLPIGLGTYSRNKVWSSASAFWGDIVKKAPLKARGHNNLGVALSEEGKVDESIKHYKQAIRLDRHYADPLSNIAVAYSMKGEIDKAIFALRGAINIFPNYAEAYNNLGTLLLKKKQYEEAERSLDMAIQIRPYYGKAFYNKGRLYLEQNKEEKAWEYFKKATEGDLDTHEGFFTLGQMSIRLKKYTEAINAFEQILKRGFTNPTIEFNLANAYFMEKNLEKSQRMYQRLVNQFPLDGKYLYNLAETYFSQNNFSAALNLFRRVTTLPEPLGQSHFRVVNCLEKLGKVDNALDYLNNLSKMNSPEDFKQFAREELARIELAQKVKDGKGSIRMSQLSKILRKAVPPEMVEAAKKKAEAKKQTEAHKT